MQIGTRRSSASVAGGDSAAGEPAVIAGVRLVSSSPRRRQLIELAGWPVEVRPGSADESPRLGESGRELTRRLALLKVQAAEPAAGEIALAADTTVVDGAELLGKPADPAEARRMLRRLRGRRHTVLTSIAVRAPDGTVLVDTCESSVPMRAYGEDEIERYAASGEPLDKAGGYNIQDGAFAPVDRHAFHDCFANVMGLPLCHVVRALRRFGVEPAADVPAACTAHLGYECRVYPSILAGTA